VRKVRCKGSHGSLYTSLSAHLDLIIFEFVIRDIFGGKLWISD
jgi:hypothetical protein